MTTTTTNSEAETIALGRDLGGRLAAGDVVLLDGPLGAGKTAFARGLAEGLGCETDAVASFLQALAEAAGLTVHVRLLEGRETQHVLDAIFKALGAALGEALRPKP